jgi:hypothetical protein
MLFFGAAGQMFYYLYEKQSLSKQLFYLETDDKNVLKQLEFLLNKEKKHPLIVIVFGHPNNPNWPQILSDPKNKDKVKDLEKSKDLIKMLTENLYQAVVSDKAFVIFNYNSQI